MPRTEHVAYSLGNSKIGKTLSYSVTPVKTCPANVPCRVDCYATQGTFQFGSVQDGYAFNLYNLIKDPTAVLTDLDQIIKAKKPAYFRWNVAGDFFSKDYIRIAITLAYWHPEVHFMAYTKWYDLVQTVISEEGKPKNLSIILSRWADYPCNNYLGLPESWVIESAADRKKGMICGGDCEVCQKNKIGCWFVENGNRVNFIKHGQRTHMTEESKASSYIKWHDSTAVIMKKYGLDF